MGFGTDLLKGAATGGVSSALGAVGSMIGGAIQYRQQKKLMKQQNQYNIDQFNRENERQDYLMANSARIQKDALKNAGISAATLGGDFGNATPSTNQSQGVDVPSAPTPDVGAGRNVAGELSQMKQAESTSNLNDSVAEKNKAEAALIRKQVGTYDVQFGAEQDKRVSDAAKAKSEAAIQRIRQEIEERGKDNRITLSSLEVAEMSRRVANLLADHAHIVANTANINEQTENLKAKRSEIVANIKNLNSLTVKNLQEAATSKALAQIYKDEHSRKEAKDLLVSAEAAYKSYLAGDLENSINSKLENQTFELNGESVTANGYMIEMCMKAQELVNAVEEGDLIHAKTIYETLRPDLEKAKLEVDAVSGMFKGFKK